MPKRPSSCATLTRSMALRSSTALDIRARIRALQVRHQAHGPVGEVTCHIRAQLVLLVSLGEQQPLIEAVGARCGQLLGLQQLLVAGADGERDHIRDLVLGGLVVGRNHQRALEKILLDDAHHRGRLLATVGELRTVGDERVAQALGEIALAVLYLEIRGLERCRQRRVPLQMEAATRREGREHHEQRTRSSGYGACGPRAPHTTTLTSLPGTTTTRRTFLPATNFCTCSSASAAARTAPSSALTAMLMRPRSLPFTCTTISTVCCASARASGAGQRSSMSAVPCPSARHNS